MNLWRTQSDLEVRAVQRERLDAVDRTGPGDVVQKELPIAEEDIGGVRRSIVGEVHIGQRAIHAVQMQLSNLTSLPALMRASVGVEFSAALFFGVVVGQHRIHQRQGSGWVAIQCGSVLGVVVFQGGLGDGQTGLRMGFGPEQWPHRLCRPGAERMVRCWSCVRCRRWWPDPPPRGGQAVHDVMPTCSTMRLAPACPGPATLCSRSVLPKLHGTKHFGDAAFVDVAW